uniref:Uncharacterized protein n=1 Tax=Arundo donax TaxID=35708 RepID=A0A0A8ZV98_ARUDO
MVWWSCLNSEPLGVPPPPGTLLKLAGRMVLLVIETGIEPVQYKLVTVNVKCI